MRFGAIVLASTLLMTPLVAKADTITMALGEYPPYVSKSLPDHGLHVKKFTEAMEAAGHTVEITWVPWKRSMRMVKDGEATVTVPWYKTEERMQDYLYPDKPISFARFAVFYKKDQFPDGLSFDSLEAIAASDVKVTGVDSFYYVDELRDMGKDVHHVSKGELAWRLLDRDRVDIYLENVEVGKYEIAKYFGEDRVDEFGVAGFVREEPFYALFTKNDETGAIARDAWDAHAEAAATN